MTEAANTVAETAAPHAEPLAATESAMGDGTSPTSAPIVGETDAALVLENVSEEEAPAAVAEPAAEAVVPAEAVARPSEEHGSPTRTVETGAESLVAKAMAAVTEPAPEPVFEHVSSPSPAPASQPAYAPAPAPADLEDALSDAGLHLVQTDAAKLANAVYRTPDGTDAPRVSRERRRMAPPPAEPLAQVETRKN